MDKQIESSVISNNGISDESKSFLLSQIEAMKRTY